MGMEVHSPWRLIAARAPPLLHSIRYAPSILLSGTQMKDSYNILVGLQEKGHDHWKEFVHENLIFFLCKLVLPFLSH